MVVIADEKRSDKKLKLISRISELADKVTLEYVKKLSAVINDKKAGEKKKAKAFAEMDKVLRIAKQYSDRQLLAEGKNTENIGLGGMPFEVTFVKNYEGAAPETDDDVTGDRCESDD
jgi:hypothetical protein